MNAERGIIKYLKFTTDSIRASVEPIPFEMLPADNNEGAKNEISTIITIIMLNAIIRYLNFNTGSPKPTDNSLNDNDKIKIILRQHNKHGIIIMPRII